MQEFTLTENDNSRNIDLGNSPTLTVTNLAGNSVQVFIDYIRDGSGVYWSAIKATAGYGDPFTLPLGDTKTVKKSDLLSENVRVAIKGVGARVKFVY